MLHTFDNLMDIRFELWVDLMKYISNVNVKRVGGRTLRVWGGEVPVLTRVFPIFHPETVKYTQINASTSFTKSANNVAPPSLGIGQSGQLYFLCASFCLCAFSSGWELPSAGRVQHCWVFHQMNTRYESARSSSQGRDVCVGRHIAYVETTQVP